MEMEAEMKAREQGSKEVCEPVLDPECEGQRGLIILMLSRCLLALLMARLPAL